MKRRIRSQETNETLRIEIPDPSSLSDLKTLIAAKLSPPVPASSIRLSVNRRDELLSPSPTAPLPSLGLTSGDLLFFSLTSNPSPIALVIPPAADPMDQTCEIAESVSKVSPVDSISKVSPVESISKISSCLEEGASSEGDLINSVKKPPPFATSLKRVMHAELGEARGDLGLVVVTVHAVFLEAGFVIPAPVTGPTCRPAGQLFRTLSGISVTRMVPRSSHLDSLLRRTTSRFMVLCAAAIALVFDFAWTPCSWHLWWCRPRSVGREA